MIDGQLVRTALSITRLDRQRADARSGKEFPDFASIRSAIAPGSFGRLERARLACNERDREAMLDVNRDRVTRSDECLARAIQLSRCAPSGLPAIRFTSSTCAYLSFFHASLLRVTRSELNPRATPGGSHTPGRRLRKIRAGSIRGVARRWRRERGAARGDSRRGTCPSRFGPTPGERGAISA
jgi:hypothetical protein